MTEKMWGSEPFWGLGYEWDPDWVYTEHQKELRSDTDRALRDPSSARTPSASTTS